MELSKRLQAVADLLDCHEKIADIGCDHGFVSIYLIENKKASWCLAMDVNSGPLERAREHVLEKRLSTYIETRLSDGAKEIRFVKDECGKDKLDLKQRNTAVYFMIVGIFLLVVTVYNLASIIWGI